MTASEWVTIISCACAVICSLIGGTWILSWKLSDLSKEQATIIAAHKAEVEKKIARNYDRLDEYKDFLEAKIVSSNKDMKEDFVCKNVCKILHEQNDKTTARLETKVDGLAVKFEEGFREMMKAMRGEHGERH